MGYPPVRGHKNFFGTRDLRQSISRARKPPSTKNQPIWRKNFFSEIGPQTAPPPPLRKYNKSSQTSVGKFSKLIFRGLKKIEQIKVEYRLLKNSLSCTNRVNISVMFFKFVYFYFNVDIKLRVWRLKICKIIFYGGYNGSVNHLKKLNGYGYWFWILGEYLFRLLEDI
jgi:hypothetical protein